MAIEDMISDPVASPEVAALADRLTGREQEYAELRAQELPKPQVVGSTPEKFNLYNTKGDKFEVSNFHDYNYYLNTGQYLPETETTKALHQAVKDSDSAEGIFTALASSYVDELTMGAAGYAASKSMDPIDLARLHILQERSPITSFIGRAAGFASMLAATSGVGGIVRGTAGTAAKAVARTAVEGAVKEGVTAAIGKAVAETTAKEVAGGILGKVARTVAKQATVGAAMNAPLALTEAYYGDYRLAGETLAHGAVVGSLFGIAQSAVSLAASGAAKGAKLATEKYGLSSDKIIEGVREQKVKAIIQSSRADAGELRRVMRAARTGKIERETEKLVEDAAESVTEKGLKESLEVRNYVAGVWEKHRLFPEAGEKTMEGVMARAEKAKSAIGRELHATRLMSDNVLKSTESLESVKGAVGEALSDVISKTSSRGIIQPGERQYFRSFLNNLKSHKSASSGFSTEDLVNLRKFMDEAAYSSEKGSVRGRIWRDVRASVEELIEKRVQKADDILVSRGAPPLLSDQYKALKREFAVLAESEPIFVNAEGRSLVSSRSNMTRHFAPIVGAMMGANIGGALGAAVGSQAVPMGVQAAELHLPRAWVWVNNAIENKQVIDSMMSRWASFGDKVGGALRSAGNAAKPIPKIVAARDRDKREAERVGRVLAQLGADELLKAIDIQTSKFRTSLPSTADNMHASSAAIMNALAARNPYDRAPSLRSVGRTDKTKPVSEVAKVKWSDIVALAKEPALSVQWMQHGKLTREHISFLDDAFPAHAEQIRKMASERVTSLRGSALYSYRALMREPGKTVWFGSESSDERKSVIKFGRSPNSGVTEMTRAQKATAR